MNKLKSIIAALILCIPGALYVVGAFWLFPLIKHDPGFIGMIWFILYGIPLLCIIFELIGMCFNWAAKQLGIE